MAGREKRIIRDRTEMGCPLSREHHSSAMNCQLTICVSIAPQLAFKRDPDHLRKINYILSIR